ncbi:MAG: DUF2232 domain-containing protein [Clostridia bacterium]|nr:DUF2232 domain-containing protein [Clostridia bacterium]
MNHNKTKALREGAMMVALTIIFVLISVYVPILSFLGTFAAPVPMAAFAARNGLKHSWVGVVSVFVLTVFVTGGNIFSAVSTVLMSVIPGAVCGYFLGKRALFFNSLIATSVAVAIGWVFELLVINVFAGSGIDEMIAQAGEQFKAISTSMLQNIPKAQMESLGVSSPEAFAAQVVETFEYTIKVYLPSFVIISAATSGYIILRISAFVIIRAKIAEVSVVKFSMMKAPNSMSTALLLFYIIHLLLTPGSLIWLVLANIVIILYAILSVCGLSFVDYKFKKKVRSAWVRGAIYFVVFLMLSAFSSILSTVLIIIAILDSRRDFRSIGSAENYDG